MDIRRRATYPGGRVGTLILAVMLLVVSSGLFAGQQVQAAAPSDKIVAQPATQANSSPSTQEAYAGTKLGYTTNSAKPEVQDAPNPGLAHPTL